MTNKRILCRKRFSHLQNNSKESSSIQNSLLSQSHNHTTICTTRRYLLVKQVLWNGIKASHVKLSKKNIHCLWNLPCKW